ncbi:MAG: hypothetical protein JSR82_10900 [Verrucomicrobia bacterium]|nr:hypothetical protein [Verrucomicrobiota bacterium]
MSTGRFRWLVALAAGFAFQGTLWADLPAAFTFRASERSPARPKGGLDARPITLARGLAEVAPGTRLACPLEPAAAAPATMIVRSVSSGRPGSRLLEGEFEGLPRSHALLVEREGVWAGEFWLDPHRRWSVQGEAAGEGKATLVQVDVHAPLACAHCQSSPSAGGRAAAPTPALALPPGGPIGAQVGAPPLEYDLLYVYTRLAREGAGSVAAIEAIIDAAVARVNLSYRQSGIALRARLVGTMEYDLAETTDIFGDQRRLRAAPEVRARRDELQADLVTAAVAVQPGAGPFIGASDLMPSYVLNWGREAGYSICDYQALRVSPGFVGHELGHSMGCDHELAFAGLTPLRPDARAWNFRGRDGREYCTVLARGGAPTYLYADPALYFEESATGSYGTANNAAVIRSTAPFFTRYRPLPPRAQISAAVLSGEASFSAGTVAEIELRRTGGVRELPIELYLLFDRGTPGIEYQLEGVDYPRPPSARLVIPAGAEFARLRVLPRGVVVAQASVPPPQLTVRVQLLDSTEYDYEATELNAAFTIRDRGPLLNLDPTPRSALINVSTRLQVETGTGVAIAGFVLSGDAPKRCLVRALGPSLTAAGVNGALADPQLELRDSDGQLVAQNDAWADDAAASEVRAAGLAPGDALEGALLRTLAPGAYTAVVRGAAAGTGVALVEVYDLAPAPTARPVNVSTRGSVGTGERVLIGGFVLQGDRPRRVIVRALGPSLAAFGVNGALNDPVLELRDALGNLAASNDDWQQSQAVEIRASGFAPTRNAEAALIRTLAPGLYTAIVRGKSETTGVGLVEVYDLDPHS